MKRARQVPTIASQFLPLTTSRPETGPARAATPRSARLRVDLSSAWPAKAGGWGVIVAFGIFAVAVGVTAYYAVQEIDDTAGRTGMTPPAAAGPAEGAHVASAPAPDDHAMLARPTLRDEAASVESAAVAPLPPIAAPKGPPRARIADQRSAKVAAMPADSQASGRIDGSDGMPSATEAADPTSTAANVAPAAITEEPRTPDRWEAMNAALARCSSENFLARIACSEGARFQYCDGFWGQVPQCRGAARTESSR